MAFKAPIIRIEPEGEIRFTGPFNSTVSTQLRLANMTERKVFFKIKTTAPRSYCVRPNNGLIGPLEVGLVQVMLQPFDYNPHDKERSKHKFMVQSRYAPEDAVTADSDNAFKLVTEGVEMHDARLRCLFELPSQSDDHNPSSTSEPLQQSFEKKVNQEPPETTTQDLDSSPLRIEVDTIRRRNAALIMENIELKKATARPPSSLTPATHVQSQRKTFTLLNILLALMILVLGWIIGRSF